MSKGKGLLVGGWGGGAPRHLIFVYACLCTCSAFPLALWLPLDFIVRFVFALYFHIDGGTVNIPQLSL